VGVENHLLRLARIDANERHPAVTEPDMSGLLLVATQISLVDRG
jgi:hypothetical protein